MTLPGHHPLDDKVLRRMARMVQLHLETHPERVARRFGVSVSYVRQQWRTMDVKEMASLRDVLDDLIRSCGP